MSLVNITVCDNERCDSEINVGKGTVEEWQSYYGELKKWSVLNVERAYPTHCEHVTAHFCPYCAKGQVLSDILRKYGVPAATPNS